MASSFLLAYFYDVFAHERCSWLQMVHEIFVAELSLILVVVVNAIPWFEADEGGILAVGCPYAYTWSVELHGN